MKARSSVLSIHPKESEVVSFKITEDMRHLAMAIINEVNKK